MSNVVRSLAAVVGVLAGTRLGGMQAGLWSMAVSWVLSLGMFAGDELAI